MITSNSIKIIRLNTVIIVVFSILILISCENESSREIQQKLSANELLAQYCENHEQNLKAYNHVIVINEIGTCINCNNIFAKAQGNNLYSDSTLFIVSGIGNKVDLSAYIDNNSTNLILDQSADFDTLDIVSSCAIITLEGKQIKSIENINVNNVHGLSERKW